MIHLVRNPLLDARLVEALVQMRTDIASASEPVKPVTRADGEPIAEDAFARVRTGQEDLVVAFEDAKPVGFGVFAAHTDGRSARCGRIHQLQVDSRRRGSGVTAAVLAELERLAEDRGLECISLIVRDGTGPERLCEANGYRIVARLRVGEDHDPDTLVLVKSLPLPSDGGVLRSPCLRVRRLDPGLPLPSYAHPGDAGLDLRAREDVTLEPGQRAVVPTGVAIVLPPGCVGLVHPRSGLAARHGIALVNAPGTVDAGYRGEIKVILVNLDPTHPVRLARGDRIAQLVIQRVETVSVHEVAELDSTSRGDGGFGSTGW